MKIAIIHDWLVTFAGAERVLEQLLQLYPDADIFTIVDFMPVKDRSFLQEHKIYTSFVQRLPLAKTKYRSYLPLMPFAIEQFNLSAYDLVISSSHAVAKGVITGPDQKHVCLCYSPIRYAWDLQHQYLHESGMEKGLKSFFARYFLHKIRIWDSRTSNGVDHFIAISEFIAKRIWKVYRRESEVIYPPVDIESFTFSDSKEEFYLTTSRMVPYKKIDLIVEAFKKMHDKRLVVIGTGPDFQKIKSVAQGASNIELMGFQPFEVLKDHMQKARAFIFAAEEDFGIAPLEAQACGTPVIAYGKGGTLETIVDGKTGCFFDEQTVESICDAVERFEKNTFDYKCCRENAIRFGPEIFRENIIRSISKAITND